MTITISENDGMQVTYDNQSMMAERGKIGYGVITEQVCYDGGLSKKEAKEKIIEALKEFLK